MTDKTKVSNSTAQKELDNAQKQFDAFDESVKEMTLDRMNAAPKQDVEPQTKLSSRDLEKARETYIKPTRTIGSKERFDEKWRKEYNFSSEYVRFIAENKEIIGETIEMWTKPFPGMAAEFWKLPTNKPIWAPRYVAEQVKRCSYHRLVMQQGVSTGGDGMGQYYGAMAVDTTVQRLDALPVSANKSIFMGASGF